MDNLDELERLMANVNQPTPGLSLAALGRLETALYNAAPSLIATAREVEGLRKQLAETADLAFAAQQDSIRLAGEVEGLRAEVARLREHIARQANTINVVGSPYHKAQEALDALVAAVKREARAALKGKGG